MNSVRLFLSSRLSEGKRGAAGILAQFSSTSMLFSRPSVLKMTTTRTNSPSADRPLLTSSHSEVLTAASSTGLEAQPTNGAKRTRSRREFFPVFICSGCRFPLMGSGSLACTKLNDWNDDPLAYFVALPSITSIARPISPFLSILENSMVLVTSLASGRSTLGEANALRSAGNADLARGPAFDKAIAA